jgi:hypothetical protein
LGPPSSQNEIEFTCSSDSTARCRPILRQAEIGRGAASIDPNGLVIDATVSRPAFVEIGLKGHTLRDFEWALENKNPEMIPPSASTRSGIAIRQTQMC